MGGLHFYCHFKPIAFANVLFYTMFHVCQHVYLPVAVGRRRTNHGYTRSSVKAAKVCAKKNASQLLTDWHYPLGVAFLIVNR